uniref:Exodeoxyribonuclease 7 small subunit n=1 Tax=Desulfomonile tiedjei TaxID=2358 RepID=A0A7C4ATC1_9BACT
MTKAQSDDNAGSERFDAYLDKLRAIVEKMEQGGVGLEESLKLFEEGIQVSRRLFGILNEVEGKVEQLLSTMEKTPINKEME